MLILLLITGSTDEEKINRFALMIVKRAGGQKLGNKYLVEDKKKLQQTLEQYDERVKKHLIRERTLERLLEAAQMYYFNYY